MMTGSEAGRKKYTPAQNAKRKTISASGEAILLKLFYSGYPSKGTYAINVKTNITFFTSDIRILK
jgi:hypothetical protein